MAIRVNKWVRNSYIFVVVTAVLAITYFILQVVFINIKEIYPFNVLQIKSYTASENYIINQFFIYGLTVSLVILMLYYLIFYFYILPRRTYTIVSRTFAAYFAILAFFINLEFLFQLYYSDWTFLQALVNENSEVYATFININYVNYLIRLGIYLGVAIVITMIWFSLVYYYYKRKNGRFVEWKRAQAQQQPSSSENYEQTQ
ncbi:hypothetical protein ACA758_03335 [Mycoplasmopsis agassizii]|uniref:hypothetical protein n=1 Tax=Mycoplasmopsis agassizii TaxID=33922 RepID=UPI0035286BF5